MSGKYDYINAKIKGMSSYLLKKDFYEQAISVKNIDAFFDLIMDTAYKNDIQKELLVKKYTSALETALFNNLEKVFKKVANLSSENSKLLRILLNRWDIDCILAIIKGIFNKINKNEILASLPPAGQIKYQHLEILASQTDFKSLQGFINTWNFAFAHEIGAILKNYEDNLHEIEMQLYNLFFKWAFDQLDDKEDSQILKKHLSEQVDILNIKIALKKVSFTESSISMENPPFIAGGKLNLQKIIAVSESKTFEDAFVLLENSYFSPGIEKGILFFGQRRRFSEMERFLELVVIENACKLFRTNPLEIGVPIGFLWRKYNEFINLRIILRGILYKVPPNTIREEILLV